MAAANGKKKKLTPKQSAFVDEYLIDMNGTAAAIRAGYSSRRAAEIAYQQLHKATVQAAIQAGMDARAKRTGITADKVLEELAHIAFDDIKNYLAFRTEKTVVGHGDNGEPIFGYNTIVDMKDSAGIDTRGIAEVSTGPNGQFKFKLYEKDSALVQLGKHLGMFSDKTQVQVSGSVEVELSLADKMALIKKMAAKYGGDK